MTDGVGMASELLSRILSRDNLRLAWEEVAERQGAPGSDAVSIKRWRRNWEERLARLSEAVRSNTYRSGRVRYFSVPKKDGSQRRLSILTVTDRVLQRAVLRVIDDLFDRVFLDCSFGYRIGRGVRDAIPVILEHRMEGRQWVLDADIDDCFDSLDHELMRYFFQQTVDDPTVCRLISQWLAMNRRKRGILMGAVISPLLCNLYLHRLDQALVSYHYHPVRYADDFCVFCHHQSEAEEALQTTIHILSNLRLRLEFRKTNITHFDDGFQFLGISFYRDQYSFISQGKRVEIEGNWQPDLFSDYIPEGYEA